MLPDIVFISEWYLTPQAPHLWSLENDRPSVILTLLLTKLAEVSQSVISNEVFRYASYLSNVVFAASEHSDLSAIPEILSSLARLSGVECPLNYKLPMLVPLSALLLAQTPNVPQYELVLI